MSNLVAFARRPLLWSAGVLALYAPFAFVQPVLEQEDGCDDWLWCSARYVGLVFDPNPDPGHLLALLIVPGAFLAFLAAHVDGRGAGRSAHWYMAPFVLTLALLSIYFLFAPFSFFVSVSESYRPAILLTSQHLALVLAIFASVFCGLIILGGTLLRRWLTPRTA